MLQRTEDLLALDLSKVNVRGGLVGAGAVLLIVALVMAFGFVAEIAAFATLFVLATDHTGSPRDRMFGVVIVTLFGAAIGFLAVVAGTDQILLAATLTFVVTAAATVVAALGPNAAGRALVLSVWAVLALGFAGSADTALEMATAFLVGGAVASVAVWIKTRRTLDDSVGRQLEAGAQDEVRSISDVIRSWTGWFALLRAGAVAVGTILGIILFPEHPMWAALTVLLVIRPKAGATVSTGVLRTVGTLVGVLAAEAIVGLSGGSELVIALAFVLSAFGMIAFKDVSYWVFVAFVTGVVILVEGLVGENIESAAVSRVMATLLGAGIALVTIAMAGAGMRWWNARHPEEVADSAAE